MPTSREVRQSVLILVEGQSDKAFIEWIAGHHGLSGFVVESLQGKDKKTKLIEAIVREDRFGRGPAVIAAIVDADNDPEQRRKSFDGRLRDAAPNARRYVYLLPDDQSEGDLEDVCRECCVHHERLICCEALLTCLTDRGQTGFSKSKLLINVYLATRTGGRIPLEWGLQSEEFDPNGDLVGKIAAFIRTCVSSAAILTASESRATNGETP